MTDLSPVKALLHTLRVVVEDPIERSDVAVEAESQRVFQRYGGLRGHALHLVKKSTYCKNAKN